MLEQFKNWLSSFINKYVDIPGINEDQEKIIIDGILEFLFSLNSGQEKMTPEEKQIGEDFLEWAVSFVNNYVDIPFLSEETEEAFIEAIFTLLFNFQPPK